MTNTRRNRLYACIGNNGSYVKRQSPAKAIERRQVAIVNEAGNPVTIAYVAPGQLINPKRYLKRHGYTN